MITKDTFKQATTFEMTDEMAQELHSYYEALEYYTEIFAEYQGECIRYGDASFSKPTPPQAPEWEENYNNALCIDVQKHYDEALRQIEDDEVPF